VKHFAIIIISFFLLSSFSISKVWEVPGDCSTIQAALDSCQTGDTVRVAKGIYYENIIWPNTQSICLIGENNTGYPIIDGGKISRVIDITAEVDRTTIIKGFIIRNGVGYEIVGAGIRCGRNSSPTITGNIIRDNVAMIPGNVGGGGIFCDSAASPLIIENIIFNNIATWGTFFSDGGGIACDRYSEPEIIGNAIMGNRANGLGGGIICLESSALIKDNIIFKNGHVLVGGGGIACLLVSSSTIITGNTISENEVLIGSLEIGGGGVLCLDASPTITYNIISDNTSNNGAGIFCKDGSNPVINYNNIYNNNGYGLKNADSTLIIDAEYNWWGDASGPSGVGPGTGDSVSQWVDYEPWLEGVSEIEERLFNAIPKDYVVYQNFPNPFNPKTSIRFDIPELTFITIKIYDLLGNEIETLVNEEKPAGTYEITWYAEGLPSGVYFYRLQAGDFVETKKMVLLK